MIEKTVYIFILIELLTVSIGDMRTKKIPNFWTIFNIIIFIVFLFTFPTQYPFIFSMFLHSLAFLAVGFVLFLLKIMGGGDSKFLFSFFLLVPLSLHSILLNNLLISTTIIGSAFLLRNIIKNYQGIYYNLKIGYLRGLKNFFGTKFPYAPVILVSWLFTGYDLRIWT